MDPETVAILIVDASNSVLVNQFPESHLVEVSIWKKMALIAESLPHPKFRLLFWNTIGGEGGFPGDALVIPYLMEKKQLAGAFDMAKRLINVNCTTCPHLGFRHVDRSWISKTSFTPIYLITDGEIGWSKIRQERLLLLKQQLVEEVQNVMKLSPYIQLSIIAVEKHDRDFKDIEHSKDLVGCDIYNIFRDHKLLSRVKEFKAYAPSHPVEPFVHMRNALVLPGFASYKGTIFSLARLGEFMVTIRKDIAACGADEEKLWDVVHELSTLIRGIISESSSPQVTKATIQSWCRLFKKTSLDTQLVQFALANSIQQAQEGANLLYSEYKAQLKQLYAAAQKQLGVHVADAIALNDQFITLPLLLSDECVLYQGDHRFISHPVHLKGGKYPSSSLLWGSTTIPAIPFLVSETAKEEKKSEFGKKEGVSLRYDSFSKQCLRQWIRAVVSHYCKLNATDDVIIHMTMLWYAQVKVLHKDDNVRHTFHDLVTTMLHKKHGQKGTEYEYLLAGNLPDLKQLPLQMGKVQEYGNLLISPKEVVHHPLSVWMFLCASYDQEIGEAQWTRCKDEVQKEFPSLHLLMEHFAGLVKSGKKMQIEQLPFEHLLDYECLIEMEDTSATGGYSFLPHKSFTQADCRPSHVLCEVGYQKLMTRKEMCVCPICYVPLSTDDFKKVGPKPIKPKADNDFHAKEDSKYGESKEDQQLQRKLTKSYIVVLKGVVGSGKSLFADQLERACRQKELAVAIFGPDRCRNLTLAEAVDHVKKQLAQEKIEKKLDVIILDTCGDKGGKVLFGTDFRDRTFIPVFCHWDTKRAKDVAHLRDYLGWSLRNVLSRDAPSERSNYTLHPKTSQGMQLCVNIHAKKSQSLFRVKPKEHIMAGVPGSLEEALALLQLHAASYLSYLVLENLGQTQLDVVLSQIQ